MDKNEIEKRMNATCDILTFLDQRIAQQVELQVEQRLEREREYWRGVITGLIVEELKHLFALLKKDVAELVRMSHDEMINRVQQMLNRAEAKLAEPMHRSGDDTPPPSKH